MAKKTALPQKESVKKRSLNLSPEQGDRGAPFSEQDVKRRLGNFTGTGEHARKGGRTSGVVGQSKQKNKTDLKSKK